MVRYIYKWRIDFARDNSYFNYALNVKNSFELPHMVLEEMETEQIIEAFLYKKAKTHQRENFLRLKDLLGNEKVGSIEVFQKYTFTYDDPEYIANLSYGMKPIRIQNLKPTSSVYRFFANDLVISSPKITFDECELLIPKMAILKIENMNRSKKLQIREIITSTPELTVYPPYGKDFPINLSYESIEFKIIYTPETLGMFEALFEIVFEEWIFVGSLNAFVITNPYELEPLYVTDVVQGEVIETPFYITNPLNTDQLVIEELYSTEPYLTLKWKNGDILAQKFDQYGNAKPVKESQLRSEELKIKSPGKKHLVNMVFGVNQTQDYYAEIHIRTSLNDIIRVPVYYHVHSDFMKFTPSVVDFGLIPRNFDMVKINLKGRSRANEPLLIQDILVPISDSRLDFQMIESKTLQTKDTIKTKSDFFLGYVLLNPNKPGLLLQKIKITAIGQNTNQTYNIEVPIIANVQNSTSIFQQPGEQVQPFMDSANPMVTFDISEYILNSPAPRMLFWTPQYRPVILSAPLVFKNTFNVPIAIKGIINTNNEMKVTLLPEISQEILHQDIVLQPGQNIKFAQVEILTTALKISQGVKYLSLQVNNTLVPIAVQIYDKNLLCVWEEEQQKARFIQCNSGYDMNFGMVPVGEPKIRRLNITNLNPHNITIDNVSKASMDDLIVYVDKLLDKNGKPVFYQTQYNEEKECKINIMNQKRTKRIINFTIQPYQTLCIVFFVQSKEPKLKQSKIDFQTRKKESQEFSINYSYQILSGNLTIVPQIIRFNGGYPGNTQTRQLIARSTFDVPIIIKQIVSSDLRIFPSFPQMNSNLIFPNNKTEIATISFDPGKLPTNINGVDPQFLQSLSGLDPTFSQNILNIFSGGQPSPNTQITMIMNQGQQVQINQFGQVPQPQYTTGQKPMITLHDVNQYKEKQKIWDRLGTMGKTEINAQITIETNVFQNISVQVRAHLAKPSIVDDDTINFDLVQIGHFINRSIKIVNPSEDPLILSLFISQEPLTNLADTEITNKTEETIIDEVFAKIPNPRESAFVTYCSTKIKDLLATAEKDYLDELNIQNLSDLDISSRANQQEQCWILSQIIGQQKNSLNLDEEQRQNLIQFTEAYYKDLIIESQQLPLNGKNQQIFQNLMRINKDFTNNKHIKNEWQQQQLLQFNNLAQQLNMVQQQQELEQQYGNSLDVERFAQYTNRLTGQKQIDFSIAKLFKEQEVETNKGFFENFKSLLKSSFLFKQSQSKAQNQGTNMKKQNTEDQNQATWNAMNKDKENQQIQKKFRMKNSLLNEIIILNDTSKVRSDTNNEYLNPQQRFFVSNQSFYINPKYQGVQFKVDSRSNFTIKDAIIFQPQSFSENIQMYLTIKNNLTVMQQVELKGSSGTGLIDFLKVQKKSPSLENLVAANNIHYSGQFSQLDIDNENHSEIINPQLKNTREKIISYIYGDKIYIDPKTQNQIMRRHQNLERILEFDISESDMFQFQDQHNDGIYNADQNPTSQEQLMNKQQRIINNYHKRVYVAQNMGNLPIAITQISIDGQGCKSIGIKIENCHSFSLKPGESHNIHISYQTDYTIGRLKKTLILESQFFVQEFQLEIKMPLELLQLAHQIQPMSSYEQFQMFFLKVIIIIAGSLGLFYTSRDAYRHFQFKQEQLDQEKLDYILQQEMMFKLNQQIKCKELPIMKEMLGHEQIYSVFQTAQEKFDNPNQLLLKEVSNICSKKNLVCVEAQKQAIDAEKERRMHSRHINQHNMTINKYLERKDKEEMQTQSRFENPMAFQPILPTKYDQKVVHTQSSEIIEKKQNLILIHNESKDSNFTDLSLNESLINPTLAGNSKPATNKEQNQITINQKQDQQQNIKPQADTMIKSSSIPSETLATQKELINTSQQNKNATTVSRMSKKQKRETAQRFKEQQEMEERFRQAQLKKEREMEIERKKKEQEEQRVKELARKAQEEYEQLQRQINEKANQPILPILEEQTKQDNWDEPMVNSQNQSIHYEKENSLNLSQIQIDQININEEKQKSQMKKDEQQFKKDLDYIGDLNDQRISFISERENDDKDKDQNQIQKNTQLDESNSQQQSIIISEKVVSEAAQDHQEESIIENDSKQNQDHSLEENNDNNNDIQVEITQMKDKQESRDSHDQEDIQRQNNKYQVESDYNNSAYESEYYKRQYQSQQIRGQNYTYDRRNPHRQYYQNPQPISQSYGYRSRGQGVQYPHSSVQYQRGGNQFYSYSQGRGITHQSSQGLGYKKSFYNQGSIVEEDDSQYYDRRAQQQIKEKEFSLTQNRRVTINNNPIKSSSNSYNTNFNTRLRGKPGNSGYYSRNEYEDEQIEQQQNYWQGTSYQSHQYQKKHYPRDEYDEERSQQEQAYYKQKFQKKNYQNSQEYNQEYGSEDDSKQMKYERQESSSQLKKGNKNYDQYQHDQNDSKAISVPESQKNRPSDLNITTENEDEELKQDVGKRPIEYQQYEQNQKEISHQLSKDDLKPFFDSQRKPDENVFTQRNNQRSSNLTSPNAGSLFSFNPLNLFSQQISSNLPTNRDPSPEYARHLNQIIDDDEDEDTNMKEIKVYDKSKRSSISQASGGVGSGVGTTDYFNAFKSASSLFSKPLFGATISRQNQMNQQTQNKNIGNRMQEQEEDYGDQNQHEEEEDNSLFSGSLFGDSGPFGINKKMQTNPLYENQNQVMRGYYDSSQGIQPRQQHQEASDGGFFPPPGLLPQPIQGTSGASYVPYYQQPDYPSSIHTNQDSYSLFGNAFGNFNIANQVDRGQYYPQQQQRLNQGHSWQQQQYYDDQEEEESQN